MEALVALARAEASGIEPVGLTAEVLALRRSHGSLKGWLGEAWERLAPEAGRARHGQFFTPPALARLMWSRISGGGRALDPTCGAGGLLLAAPEGISERVGCEIEPLLAEIAGLRLADRGPTRIVTGDAWSESLGPADVVLANPPFGVGEEDLVARFVGALDGWVRPGGEVAAILPLGILAGAATPRGVLGPAFGVTAVALLPEGVFRPFGGAAVRAVVVWARKGPQTDDVAFRTVVDPGWDCTTTRWRPTSGRDLDEATRGLGWGPWGASAPVVPRPAPAVRVGDLARVGAGRIRPARRPDDEVVVIDLASVHARTGEISEPKATRGAEIAGQRLPVAPGEVLFSRIRPELGKVAVVPPEAVGWVGSPEWVPLQTAWPYTLRLALRSPAFVVALGLPQGSTRPRVDAETVLGAPVAWPSTDVAALVEGVARGLSDERRALARRERALERAWRRFAAGELSEGELRVKILAMTEP